jgi:hypothetical protein
MNESTNTENGTTVAGRDSSELLSTKRWAVGAFDGFAGEGHDWGLDYVRVVVKVAKPEAMAMKDVALIRMNW